MNVLVSLYAGGYETIISKRLSPFVAANEESLFVLYAEHDALPEAELLDLIEAPMILELLECESARLAHAWPGSPSPLIRLAEAAGMPLEQLA